MGAKDAHVTTDTAMARALKRSRRRRRSARSSTRWSMSAGDVASGQVASPCIRNHSRFRIELAQPFAQLGHAPAGVLLHRAERDAEGGGNLGFGEVDQIAKGQHLAL